MPSESARNDGASIPEIEVNQWCEFEDAIRDPALKGWAFRGQAKAKWPVVSSLSRHLTGYKIHREAWPIQEYRILRLFKRKAHLFLDHIPEDSDTFEWLGLMQLFGAPTRLIDFTWSPEVAAFFSMEQSQPCPGNQCAVWAISMPKLWNARYQFAEETKSASQLSLRQPGTYEKFYLNNQNVFISTDDPFRMNQRIIAQSGTFVVPGVLGRGIDSILAEVAQGDIGNTIRKFVINVESVRSDAMAALYRMNISNATLFPGLDGTAKSLAYELETHWAYDTKTYDPKEHYEPKFAELKAGIYHHDPKPSEFYSI